MLKILRQNPSHPNCFFFSLPPCGGRGLGGGGGVSRQRSVVGYPSQTSPRKRGEGSDLRRGLKPSSSGLIREDPVRRGGPFVNSGGGRVTANPESSRKTTYSHTTSRPFRIGTVAEPSGMTENINAELYGKFLHLELWSRARRRMYTSPAIMQGGDPASGAEMSTVSLRARGTPGGPRPGGTSSGR